MSSLPNQQLQILVVEDDEFLREIVALNLQKKGFKVMTAAEGREAFEILKMHKDIRLVISDIQMPGGNGMELLKNIRAMDSGKAPVVILMTGYSDVTKKEAIEAGAYTVLLKPFQSEALFSHIRAIFPEETSQINAR